MCYVFLLHYSGKIESIFLRSLRIYLSGCDKYRFRSRYKRKHDMNCVLFTSQQLISPIDSLAYVFVSYVQTASHSPHSIRVCADVLLNGRRIESERSTMLLARNARGTCTLPQVSIKILRHFLVHTSSRLMDDISYSKICAT